MTGNGSKALRRYDVRSERGEWLAFVVISDDGYFSTVSDYGNYAYFWSHAGECFRRFLCRLEPDYLLGKLSRSNHYDNEATLIAVKRAILSGRRDGALSKDEARDEWTLLVDHDNLYSREDFAMWWHETSIGDAHELSRYDFPPDAKMFAERVWPALRKVLRAEMATEKEVA